MAMVSIRKLVIPMAVLFVGAAALAADAPNTAEVLSKLHQGNSKEIEMGKLAEQQGHSKEAKQFGRTLVRDHTAADRKVMALAKQQNLTLPTPSPMKDMNLPTGPDFDAAFAKAMLEDHRKDIAEVKSARDATSDPKLKSLLVELLPTLEKHEQMAQKLADGQTSSGKAPSAPNTQR